MSDPTTDGHYRRLLERSPAGLLVTTYDGLILEANQAAVEVLGFEAPSDLEGTNVRDRYAEPSERDEVVEELRRTGEIQHRELAIKTRDGDTAYLLVSVKEEDHPEHGEDVLITNWVDVTEQRALRTRLEHLAQHDDLTGLLNRRALFERAEQVFAMCEREDRMAAVVYLDIAGFKQVNEQVGHRGGDEVLEAIGERLKDTMRESDLVARIGGDEFVVVATLLRDQRDADQVGRRVMFAFDQPFEGADLSLQLQPAVGIAVYPDDGMDMDALLHRADQALWGPDRKKQPGFRRYQATIEGVEAPNWNVPEELQRALQSGKELLQVYQPIVSSEDGRVVGLESLVRWDHPERGRLTPGSFILTAEAAGLIRQLDRQVCRRTIDQASRWMRDGLGIDWIAINLSAQTLSNPECIEWMSQELADHPELSPHRLVLEITEHTAMQQVARNEVLLALEDEVGVSISIDDFGVGYSSLLYLRRFPAHFLKIDMEFVEQVVESEADQKVIEGIIALGNAFDMELIAEGVETDQQADWLREAGSHYLQGYLFGRPSEPEEVEELLRAS